ncbi:MAG: hypothetical protein Q9217_000139 [Psora testacea]
MPFFSRIINKNTGHSKSTKGYLASPIQEAVPLVSEGYILEVRGPVRGDYVPSEGKLSHRLSRPFDNLRLRCALPPKDQVRPETSAGAPQSDLATAKLRPGPARSVTCHTAHADARTSQYGDVQSVRPPAPRLATNSSYRAIAANTCPQSVECLYVQCGIISGQEFDILNPHEVNDIIESWAIENPVAAAHIVGLARKWRLQCFIEETIRLTDLGPRRTRRTSIPEGEPEKVYEKDDNEGDDNVSSLDHKQSEYLVQKQVLQDKNEAMASEIGQQIVFGSSDSVSPTDDRFEATELPISVQQLYADVAGFHLEDLPQGQMHKMMSDWTQRFPVSDYHLKQVIEMWSVPVELVCISPVFQRNLQREKALVSVAERSRGHWHPYLQTGPINKGLRGSRELEEGQK